MRRTVSIAILVGTCLAWPYRAGAQGFSDNFEAATLDPAWVVVQQQAGTVSLSTDQNHTGGGSQSLKFASTGGNQRYIIVKRFLGSQMKGTASVAFYDAAPGQQTLYTNFSLINSTSNVNAFMGTQDFDAFCYKAAMGFNNSGANVGPNANCGSFPQQSTTNVARTAGWHVLSINVGVQSVVFSIDGAPVYTYPGTFSFDSIQLDLSGPVWRPDTVAYFDDFSFTPLGACDIQLNQSLYVNGNTVSAPVFRLANSTPASLAVEIKTWLAVPGATASVINTGATGSVMLPPGTNLNLGPLTLFPVTAALPRGGYEFSCRMHDPSTGAILATSQNGFVIQ